MRAADLDLRELLAFEPKGGIMRLGGQRVILFDAAALGLLRKELIDTLGFEAARAILTRFGYAHGRRVAETLRSEFPWDDEREWQRAGARLHMLHGLVAIDHPDDIWNERSACAEATWNETYESEQHLLHFGLADEPICWTLTGFASGWGSFVFGREAYCIEDRCRGRGDATCHAVARFKEDWGPELEPHLRFYDNAYVDAVLSGVTAALRSAERRLRARRQELARIAPGAEDRSGIVARSESMARVVDLARRVAAVESSVLITGESGSGKERIARFIHDESSRAGRPFVAVNCAAVSETLLESELFGHARGAFTGAERDRAGLFESAGGGTLFLDEIGEVSHGMQVKLLRALQEREVRRVGENHSRPVNVRVLAATNRRLADDVAAGRFRQDLYYRLRVIELRIPPLRDRPEDIMPLARRYLAEGARRVGSRVTGFTPAAAGRLLAHPWPGNVRELQNAVEHGLALCAGSRVDVADLPEELSAAPVRAAAAAARPLADVEREHILAAVQRTGGNRTRAAAELGIGLATLKRKLKRYYKDLPHSGAPKAALEITPPSPRPSPSTREREDSWPEL
jgi:two-component system response regulator HydG